MKKKLMSLLLAGALATSMVATAAVSASALIDENGRYVPCTDETYRYYFYMPADWENELSSEAAVYWWGGTEACGALDGSGNTTQWPGYKPQLGDVENVFYIDCPQDVTGIIWSNNIDGGLDKEAPQYKLAKQTNNIGTEYYDVDESDTYPEGTENFDNMIYVIDPSKTSLTPTSQKESFEGEWYYYYGNGEYGIYPDKADAEAANDVRNTEYYPPVDPNATPDEPTTTEPTGDDNTGNQGGNTNKPGQPSTDATSGTKPAGSSSSDSANGGSNNGAVQTGAASLAVVLLAVLSSVTGIVVLTRKKFD